MIERGGEFDAFIRRQNLPEISERRLIENTVRILERTELLTGKNSANCQLVVGEVQSGKTLSFSTVVALSRDNQIPVTVILAGTKKPLLRQTHAQVLKDFNIITNENDIGGLSDFTLVIGFDPSFKELFHLIEKILVL